MYCQSEPLGYQIDHGANVQLAVLHDIADKVHILAALVTVDRIAASVLEFLSAFAEYLDTPGKEFVHVRLRLIGGNHHQVLRCIFFTIWYNYRNHLSLNLLLLLRDETLTVYLRKTLHNHLHCLFGVYLSGLDTLDQLRQFQVVLINRPLIK